MKRRALIVCCDNTSSGKLVGALQDARNIRNFLMSSGGGQWYDKEIGVLRNPSEKKVYTAINTFMKGADYTFIVFSGHGFFHSEIKKQFLELADNDVPLKSLITNSRRQTIIVDACRGYYSPLKEKLDEEFRGMGDVYHFEKLDERFLFDRAVMQAEEGLTVLYSSSKNESSLDSPSGGAYIFSLLTYAQKWATRNREYTHLSIKTAHLGAIPLMKAKFNTIQKPVMNREKRINHFPIAVLTDRGYGKTTLTLLS